MRLEVENLTYLSKKKESLYTLPGLVICLPLAVMEEYSIQLHSLGGGGRACNKSEFLPFLLSAYLVRLRVAEEIVAQIEGGCVHEGL